jgi:hypothetical protein
MVRTQLYLDEASHARLQELSRKQGRTISELVRDAIQRTFGKSDVERRLDTLKAIEGLWRDHPEARDPDAYVRRLRRDTRRRPRRR